MSVDTIKQTINQEEAFLKQYDAKKYDHPSVTVDVLVYSTDIKGNLKILLTKRKKFPFKGYWSIPGGFVLMNQSLDEAAEYKLLEKTGVKGIHIEQLYTFGDVDRDPRTRVITVSYIAMVPQNRIRPEDITEDAKWFQVQLEEGKLKIFSEEEEQEELAFDHQKMIAISVERLRGKLNYTDIAFNFIKDTNRFAIYELQKIHEAIMGYKMDTPNFRRMFLNLYVKTGRAVETGEKCVEYSGRASKYYSFVR